MARAIRALIIEDEQAIRRLVKTILTPHGWELIEADTARDGLRLAQSPSIDLILLDLGLPDGDGLALIPQLAAKPGVPIVVLSSRDQEDDKITALDLGADDYVTKPFGAGELMARLRTALRHAVQQGGSRAVVTVGALAIDLVNRHAAKDGERLHLSPTEFDLLACLAQNAGLVLTHRHILKTVWGPAKEDEVQYLRVYIRTLRQKVEDDPNNPVYIQTEPGIGYRLHEPGGS
jgi:two-component system, OmpR family, KDP operon response regulator KdpE